MTRAKNLRATPVRKLRDSAPVSVALRRLSWVLLAGAGLHLAANSRAFMNHLRGPEGRVVMGLFGVLLAARFQPLGGSRQEPPFMVSVHALAEAPLGILAQVAGLPPEVLAGRLAQDGLASRSGQQSVADLVGGPMASQMHLLADLLASAPAR